MRGPKRAASHLCIGAAAVLTSLGSTAAIAIPAPPDARLRIAQDAIDELPLDAALVIGGSDYQNDPITVRVRDQEGNEVPGEHRVVVLSDTDTGYWITKDILIVWRPRDGWTPQTRYEVEATPGTFAPDRERWRVGEVRASFTTAAEAAGVTPRAVVDHVAFELETRVTRHECCKTACDPNAPLDDGIHQGSHLADPCRHCWPAAETPHPVVRAQLTVDSAGSHPGQLLVHVRDGDGEIVNRWWLLSRNVVEAARIYEPDHAPPYCLQLAVEDLGSGEVVEFEPACVTPPAGTSLAEVELDVEQPAQCENDEADGGHGVIRAFAYAGGAVVLFLLAYVVAARRRR